jgi:ADP-ribosylation factor protein 1
MGIIFDKLDFLWNSFQSESSILVLGLDNAGKTAILYTLQLGEAITHTVPTLGFNVEEVSIGKVNIKIFDIGGQDSIRALWPHYFPSTSGVAFVIDANDIDRIEQARNELHALFSSKDLVGKPFLILLNKQDLPQAKRKEEMIDILQLKQVTSSPWHIIECIATKNDQLTTGFRNNCRSTHHVKKKPYITCVIKTTMSTYTTHFAPAEPMFRHLPVRGSSYAKIKKELSILGLELSVKTSKIAELLLKIKTKDAVIKTKDAVIKIKNAKLVLYEKEIRALSAVLQHDNHTMKEMRDRIKEQHTKIDRLKATRNKLKKKPNRSEKSLREAFTYNKNHDIHSK